MPTCVIHEEQKLNSANGRGSAELLAQPGSCSLGWMAAWAPDVAAQVLTAASHRGCQQHSSARGCEHLVSADFGMGRGVSSSVPPPWLLKPR